VLGGIGGFGALFALDRKKWKEPVLVSSADGVGTKLKIAMAMGRALHRRRRPGQSLYFNDILVQGAEPLFFLDYLAMGKLEPQVVEQLVEGMKPFPAARPAAHSSAAKPPRCPVSILPASTILRALSLARSSAKNF